MWKEDEKIAVNGKLWPISSFPNKCAFMIRIDTHGRCRHRHDRRRRLSFTSDNARACTRTHNRWMRMTTAVATFFHFARIRRTHSQRTCEFECVYLDETNRAISYRATKLSGICCCRRYRRLRLKRFRHRKTWETSSLRPIVIAQFIWAIRRKCIFYEGNELPCGITSSERKVLWWLVWMEGTRHTNGTQAHSASHTADASISSKMHFDDNLSRTGARPLETLLLPSRKAKLLT